MKLVCAYHTAVYPVQHVSIWYNVYTCHSPKYHIIVTVVYLVYCIITVCVVVL